MNDDHVGMRLNEIHSTRLFFFAILNFPSHSDSTSTLMLTISYALLYLRWAVSWCDVQTENTQTLNSAASIVYAENIYDFAARFFHFASIEMISLIIKPSIFMWYVRNRPFDLPLFSLKKIWISYSLKLSLFLRCLFVFSIKIASSLSFSAISNLSLE